jgi:hypothetical protein
MRAICRNISTILLISMSIYLSAYPTEELRLDFVGDLMAHDVNFRMNDYFVIYDDVKDILLADDCTFANLEAPVNEKEPFQTYPRFNINRSYVKAAISAGIDAFSLSNNHSFDREKTGIVQTLCSLLMLEDTAEHRIYYSGISLYPRCGPNSVTIRKKGWKIGFCAVTQFLNITQTRPYIYIVEYLNENKTREFIDFVKRESKLYDLFIISIHADVEFNREPDPRKKDFFRKLIQAGCDIVYSHHPHVLQPYENIEVDGQNGLVMYSMGNFISGMRWGSEPYKIDSYQSDTGDSIILPVTVHFSKGHVECVPKKPILITNHINERREIVIKKYDTILNKNLPKKWSDYYHQRYKNMMNFINSFKKEER